MNPVTSSGAVAIGTARPGRGEGDPGRREGQAAAMTREPRAAPPQAVAEPAEGGSDPSSLFAARVAAPLAASGPPRMAEVIPEAIAGYRFNAPAIAVRMLDPAPVSR